MAGRNFSFTLISANNLPNVRNFGAMKVYAKVSMHAIDDTEYQTSIDKINGPNPKWNFPFKYWVLQSALQEGLGVILDVELYCHRTIGDRYVGKVNINLKKLYEGGSPSNTVSMTVKVDDSQTTKGTIEFSYNIGDLETRDVEKTIEQSFLGTLLERSTMVLLAEGVKTAVLASSVKCFNKS